MVGASPTMPTPNTNPIIVFPAPKPEIKLSLFASDRADSAIASQAMMERHNLDQDHEALREREANLRDYETRVRALQIEIEASSRMVQTELGLWPENERMQLRRDVDALRARLARIPEEREQEIASIERRYSDLAHRTFPVAVTFILPAK